MSGRELNAFALEVRRWFIARGAPQRFEDEIQAAAAEAIWKTYLRKKIPLAANKGYYFTAAKRQVAEEIKQLVAPYRIGGRAARRGIFALPATVSLNDSNVSSRGKSDTFDAEWNMDRALQLAGQHGPDQLLEQVAQERARDRVVRRVLGHARGLPPAARRNLGHLLRELAPGVAVPRRKPTGGAAWGSVHLLGRVVRANALARRDRCAMIGAEETAA